MALPGNGITISLVRNTLGENKNDVGQLCTSNRINTNSFWKPVTSPVLAMTEAELFRVNDGFTVDVYSNPISLWNAIINGQTWRYNTAEAPYRLGDYRNYDRSAGPWYDWNFMNTSQACWGESRPIENSGYRDLQWLWGNFQAFNWLNPHGQDNACLGLLMSPNNSGSSESVYFYRICSTLDYDSERLPFIVPEGLNSYNQTYYFTPVLSTMMNTQDRETTYFSVNNLGPTSNFWYPLKGNVFSLYLKNQSYEPPSAFTVTVEVPEVYFVYSNYQITDLTGSFRFTINQAVTYPVNVSASIIYTNSSSPVTVASIGGTIAAGSTVYTCPWTYRDTIYTVADLKDPEEGLPFTVTWSYSYLGYTFNGTTSCFAEYNENPK